MDEPDKIIKDAMPNDNSFSFVETAGSLIQNNEFASGFKTFQTTSSPDLKYDAFIYTILSSIADDVGSTLYSNIKNYIDYVSNVDVCKVNALKSMIKLFGFQYTLFDDFDQLPLEVLNLLDVLSIEKRYLLKNGILKPEFLDLVLEKSIGEHANDWKFQKCIDFRHLFKTNSYIVSSSSSLKSSDLTDSRKIIGTYTQLNSRQAKQLLSSDIAIDVFINDYGYRLISSEVSAGIYTSSNDQILSFSSEKTRHALDVVSACCQSAVFEISELTSLECADLEFLEVNSGLSIATKLTCFQKENLLAYDQTAYEQFVEDTFFNVLSGYLALPYNTGDLEVQRVDGSEEEVVYIYPHIQDQYFGIDVNTGFNSLGDDQILSVKAFFHIPSSFDEKEIADKIDVGDDSIDNYSGIELSILLNEIQRREESSSATVSKLVGKNSPQTRYSYYREQKVLEYQRFINNYFSQTNSDASQYQVDPNFYLIQNPGGASASLASLSNVVKTNYIGNPAEDFNFDMIRNVANHLAKVVSYISKLRVKIKQQTQKNYMKGTNLLFIYIINEWLIDYARHNNNSLSASGLSSVIAKLSAHQFKDDDENYTINAVEYYDATDYDNISSEMTDHTQLSTKVNPRFWESQGSTISPMKQDGQAFSLEEIERFYLSSLNLKEPLSGNLQAFLSTLFDRGADPSFMFDLSGDPTLSVFSSKLSSGEYASEIYSRLINLSSSWTGFNQYISGDNYEYPIDEVSDQVSNVLETKIFTDLSTQYLAHVSDVYNANEKLVQDLSLHVNALSTTYLNFISSDYSVYYKKFDSKWCYEGRDPNTGTYKHDWFINNPSYDNPDMTLYEHIYNLDVYSTLVNIINWSLNDTLEYIEDGFTTIYGKLKSQVTSKIGSYGFIDINALTLDKELSYTHDFLNGLIQTRKETLRNQLTSLQNQAINAKTTYENFNNTFTNAVANFNDNDDGYALGDSVVYCVSFNTIPNTREQPITNLNGYRCNRSSSKPGTKMYKFTRKISDGTTTWWYYGTSEEMSTGNYAFEDNSVMPYNASDSLAQKCQAIKDYMNAPTAFTFMNNDQDSREYIYGLKNEGILAVVDTTEQGIADLETQYNNVASQAAALFGINTSFPATDLYGKILALIEVLTAIDETFFDDDPNLVKYKGFLKQVINLSSDYQPVKEAFTSIFSSSELGSYMVNFIAVSELTQDNIDNLKRYRKKTDQSNLEIIRKEIYKMYETFNSLTEERDSIIQALLDQNVDVTIASGTAIEYHVAQLKNDLVNNVLKKIAIANTIISKHKNIINSYVNVISSEVSSSLDSTEPFPDVVNQQLSILNFFEHDIYKKYHQMFLTYGGRDFCYDPYYNIKNQTHPSYQIHPYLWNFVEKLDTQTMIESGFKSKVVDDLEEDLVAQHIAGYVGEFGETLSTWLNVKKGLVDYSGYLTRYEMNGNFLPKVGILGEVADYDGGFYPPAADYFNQHREEAISSIASQATRASIASQISKSFPTNLITYFELSAPADFEEDENENWVVVSQTLWDECFKDQINKYIPGQDGKTILDEYLVGAYLSAVSKSGILEQLESKLEPTFFEKYYKNLGLPIAEYIRISNQLSEYGDRIAEITLPTSEQNVYDIFKYGVDINGNSYILYKKYDYSGISSLKKLSFKKKRDTLGEIWIRLNGHPIAFPAFSGSNPAYYIFDQNRLNPTIWKHLALVDGGRVVMRGDSSSTIAKIDSKMKVFYDFEMTKGKTQIAYIAYNPDFPYQEDRQFQRFDLAWVIGSQIQTYYSDELDLEWLAFLNGSGNSIERIDFRPDSTVMSYNLDYNNLSGATYQDWPALVGYYLNESFEIDFIYLFKRFSLDQSTGKLDVSISAAFDGTGQQFFAIKNTNGIQYSAGDPIVTNEIESIQKRIPVGDDACITFDSARQYMSFAFITEPLLSSEVLSVGVETTKNSVDFIENTNGPVLEDPTQNEMNSHDFLNQGVTIVEFFRKRNAYLYKKSMTYNLNADISYIPNYPGHNHEVQAFALYPNAEQHAIELLGSSRDIDKYLNLVNPSPDPYFDYEKIMDTEVFGRVYEDYNQDLDKSYRYLVNPLLGANSPSYEASDWKEVSTTPSEIYYKVKLANLGKGESKYTQRDLNNMQVLIANPENLGKNPYAMCQLVDLSNGTMLFYTSHDDDVVDTKISSGPLDTTEEYFAIGTPTSIKQKPKTSINRFSNIESISAKYTDDFNNGVADLEFVFKIEDPRKPAFIDSSTFNILLHNSKDLTMFKYYHLLDAYGAVNCRYLVGAGKEIDLPDDGRGWGIYYDKTKTIDDVALSSIESYYTRGSNLKNWLKDIELSDYDYLSDVYVLAGYKGLGFKYDEELRFDVSSDLYYYPTMNLKYPKSAANAIDTANNYSSKGDLSVLEDIFGENNLFVMDLEDPNAIADKIGKVAIPVMVNNVEDVRVFEDWLDYGEGDLSSIHNYEIFSKDDSQICKFIHFCGDEMPSSEILIPDEWWQKKTVEDCLDKCETELGLHIRASESEANDHTSQWTMVKIDHTTVDLSQFLKLYANYKKNSDSNTIDLYFNYFNWLDSPYIKLDGVKQYVDTIDSTYLKLKSGEDGILDVILQIKYYSDQKLRGYRNVKVLSYHIWNISDDKPKFVVKKTFEIQKNSQVEDVNKTIVTVAIETKTVELSSARELDDGTIDVTIQMNLAANKPLQSGGAVFLDFPRTIIDLENGQYSGFVVEDAEDDEDGLKKIVVSNSIYGSYNLKFKTKMTAEELERYKNQVLAISIYQVQMFDLDGVQAKSQVQDGWMKFI